MRPNCLKYSIGRRQIGPLNMNSLQLCSFFFFGRSTEEVSHLTLIVIALKGVVVIWGVELILNGTFIEKLFAYSSY